LQISSFFLYSGLMVVNGFKSDYHFGKMLRFKFNLTETYPDKYKYRYGLSLEGDFDIIVDNNLLFSEPHFSILEFLRDASMWINNPTLEQNMEYNCIDTEENPLISFIAHGGSYRIQSPWQLFECKTLFTAIEIKQAIDNLKSDLTLQIPSNIKTLDNILNDIIAYYRKS
jgi:hypothetical protein